MRSFRVTYSIGLTVHLFQIQIKYIVTKLTALKTSH